MNNIKKGTTLKSNTEMLLIAGSRIQTIDENGEVKEYMLGSDTSIILQHNANLFPAQ